jgi:hypothetical protein
MREYNGGRFVPIPTNESQNNLIAVIDRFPGPVFDKDVEVVNE